MFSIHEKFISTICGGGAQRIGGGAEPNLAPPWLRHYIIVSSRNLKPVTPTNSGNFVLF